MTADALKTSPSGPGVTGPNIDSKVPATAWPIYKLKLDSELCQWPDAPSKVMETQDPGDSLKCAVCIKYDSEVFNCQPGEYSTPDSLSSTNNVLPAVDACAASYKR